MGTAKHIKEINDPLGFARLCYRFGFRENEASIVLEVSLFTRQTFDRVVYVGWFDSRYFLLLSFLTVL